MTENQNKTRLVWEGDGKHGSRGSFTMDGNPNDNDGKLLREAIKKHITLDSDGSYTIYATDSNLNWKLKIFQHEIVSLYLN